MDVGPAFSSRERVRSRAESQIWFAAPVLEIVPSLEAGLCPVRDFVMVISRRRKLPASYIVKLCHFVVSWEGADAVSCATSKYFPAEPAAFIEFEQVDGNVLRREGEQFVEGVVPALARLVRKPGNQIKTQVRDSGRAQQRHGAMNVIPAVHAPRGLEFRIGE